MRYSLTSTDAILALAAVAVIFAGVSQATAGQFGQGKLGQTSIIIVGGTQMLSPQPIPPKEVLHTNVHVVDPVGPVSLNPQPIPPKAN